MTKKHFIALAARLAAARPTSHARLAGWLAAVTAVADAAETSNDRFDRARFLAACGVTP